MVLCVTAACLALVQLLSKVAQPEPEGDLEAEPERAARNGRHTGRPGNWCPHANFVRSSPLVSVEIARRFDRLAARR